MSPRKPQQPRRGNQPPSFSEPREAQVPSGVNPAELAIAAAANWIVNVVLGLGEADRPSPADGLDAVAQLIDRLAESGKAEFMSLASAGDEPSEELRELLGAEALVLQARTDDPLREAAIRSFAHELDPNSRRALYEASLRAHLGVPSTADTDLINNHLESTTQSEMEGSNPMAEPYSTNGGTGGPEYTVDTTNLRNIGYDWDNQFISRIQEVLAVYSQGGQPDRVLTAAIAGMLLLDGTYDFTTPSFSGQITSRLLPYVVRPLVDRSGQQVGTLTNLDAFRACDRAIWQIRGDAGAFYQELGTAGRKVIDGQRGGIVDERDQILLRSAVQAALQNYGTGGTSEGSFDLPALTTGAGPDELIGPHIQAVGLWYAGYQLEVAGLFQALQRSVEIFMNGQLPVSAEQAGQALNAYYWDQPNQMTESARWMQYTRVLGVTGGELSKDVPPNRGLVDNFMGFVSSLSEYDRQQRVADMLGKPRALNLTGEHVRKAGRDLGAVCTLYGYGYTQFGAKKLQTAIQAALDIFNLPDFQAAWGVQGAWQAIQRIMSQEFQKTPNVVKQRTLADSGKKIFDLIAANPDAWSGTSGNPLFAIDDGPGDISESDRAAFMRHAEFILAVLGSSYADVSANAEPRDTPAIATIPSLDGAGSNGHNADLAGQISALITQNPNATTDEIRKLIGV